MKQLLLLAGAAALASASPAFAKPGKANNGHGKGHHSMVHGQHGKGSLYGVGRNGCPPGHAKNPECMPPGQYKKRFELGQRVPFGYRGLLGYEALPYDLRTRYGDGLDPYSRYIYGDDYLYRVDPRTMIVQQILRTIL